MKKFILSVMTLGLLLLGCSSSETTKSEIVKGSDAQQISIEDLDWTIEEKNQDGERYIMMDLVNNSPYTIMELNITFTEKKDVSEEEKEAFYQEIKEDIGLSDEDIEQIKDRPLEMYAQTDKIVDSNESLNNQHAYYYEGYVYLKNPRLYEMVEPDIATIKFVCEDKIYVEYYDFHSKKYSFKDTKEDAFYWTDSTLGDKIPKPEVQIVQEIGDYEGSFSFEAYGVTKEDFNKYVEECKESGYTAEAEDLGDYYSAKDSEGYSLSVNFSEDTESFDVSIDRPDGE